MGVSIITPWLNHSELCKMYANHKEGAEVIIIDNGSEWNHSRHIGVMVHGLKGKYIYNKENRLFAPANNQGLQVATGEIVLFLNNDVELRQDFLAQVKRDVKAGGLYGPSMLNLQGQNYIEGWCIAATRDTWDKLDGWPEDMPGMYCEDAVLCLKAERMGITLNKTTWSAWHYSNYTSRQTPGAYDHYQANLAYFLELQKCAS
jgi:GT2 family glycosyltransferase